MFQSVIQRASTIVWNGPPGMCENKNFRKGSEEIFNAIARNKKNNEDFISIVGGGDTASFVQSLGEKSKAISHISTGGGASLELLEGKQLPGILALSDK